MSFLSPAARSTVAVSMSLSVACSGGWCGSRQGSGAAATSPARSSPPAVAQQAGHGAGAAAAPALLLETVPLDAVLEVAAMPAAPPSPEDLSASFDHLEPLVAGPRHDVEARARAVGPSTEAIFGFVRDRIRYEPYSGVLRGAGGTLDAGAGNAVDRALLLGQMLQFHGVKVRFATGTLPRERIDALVGRVFESSAPAVTMTAGENGPFMARVLRRARRDYPLVRAAIGSALAETVSRARVQSLEDIAHHAWVQAFIGGRWLDLDTAFADSTPGRAFAPISETVDALPRAWHQHVSVRVLVERLEDGKLTSTPVLEVTRPAVDLIGRDVYLLHAPAGKQSMGLGAAGVSSADRWVPMLLVADDTETGRPIDYAEAEGSGGFLDALGGGSSSSFVAEWLEFEVLRPDGRRDVTRRTLVDRGSAFWRATAPLQSATLAPLERDEHGLFGPRAIHHLQFSGGPQNLGDYLASATLAALGDETLFGAGAPLIDQLFPMSVRDLASLVWTENVIVAALNDTPRVRLYSDSPRIRVASITPGPGGELVETLDLRRDWLHGFARGATDDSIVADRKILFAALEGALEHEIVARDIVQLGGDASAVESTSGTLSVSGVTTIGQADLARVSEVSDRPEIVARLRAALGAGEATLIVIPRAALVRGMAAWWEVSASGDIRAVAGADLNESKGRARNRPGGQAPTSRPPAQTYNVPRNMTAREARLAQSRANLARFYRDLPARRAAQARQRGLEYGMLVAMVVASIAVVAYVAYDYHQRAASLAQSMEAIRAGSS